MPVNTTIFRTSTFRLAAIYMLVFAISAGAILAYVYYNTAGLLERQTEETDLALRQIECHLHGAAKVRAVASRGGFE